MRRNNSNKLPSSSKATANVIQQHPQPQAQQQVVMAQYSGQIPPPDLLKDFDVLIPGTAAKLIQWAEDEQRHRRRLESEAQAANIHAQKEQLLIAEYQMKSAFRSDMVGQIFGFIVCLGCIAGAVALGMGGQTVVACALAAIPTGAVIYAFRGQLFSKKS